MALKAEKKQGKRWAGRIAVLLLTGFAAVLGIAHLFYFTELIPTQPGTTAHHFAPALMMVLGGGYSTPDPAYPGAIQDFLNLERDRLDKAALEGALHPLEVLRWHHCHRYLITYVYLIWRFLGISWHTFKLAHLLLFLLSAWLAYALFRLGMGRCLSLLATILFISSPVFLKHVLSLRDFSKAPFFLALFLIMGRLLQGRQPRRQLYRHTALYGVVCGLGYGFRQDILILTPALLLVIWAGVRLEGGGWLRPRLWATLLFLGSFVVSALPILAPVFQEKGSQGLHDVMMGFSTDCLETLGLENNSYELNYAYYDDLPCVMRKMRAKYHDGQLWPLKWESPEDAEQASAIVWATARTFPADILTRALVAVHYILYHPYLRAEDPIFALPPLLTGMNRLHHPVARMLNYMMSVVLVVAVLYCACRSPWRFCLFLLLGAYVCGYTSLQFSSRHVFHLAWISLWLGGWCIGLTLATLGRWRRGELKAPLAWAPMLRGLAVVAGLLLLAGLCYGGVWRIQRSQVEEWIKGYESADLAALPYERIEEEGMVRFAIQDWDTVLDSMDFIAGFGLDTRFHEMARSMAGLWEEQARGVYMMVELRGNDARYYPHLDYAGFEQSCIDKSFTLVCPGEGAGQTLRFFFPVFEMHLPVMAKAAHFRGIRFPAEQADEVMGIYRVRNLSDFEFYPNLVLGENRAGLQRHLYWRPKKLEPPSRQMNRATQLIEKAQAHLAAGRKRKAFAYFKEAIEEAPLYAGEAYRPYDALLEEFSGPEARLAWWEAHVEERPQDYLGWTLYAEALLAQEDVKAALTAYTKAARLCPYDPTIPMYIGDLARRQGEYERALDAYQEAIRLKPTDFYCWNQQLLTLLDLDRCEAFLEAFSHCRQQGITLLVTLRPAITESPCLEEKAELLDALE